MPTHEYIQNAVNRSPRPRSERLRRLGGSIVNASVTVSSGTSPGGLDSHYHTNLEELEQIRISDGYLYFAEAVADDYGSIIQELTKAKAGFADQAQANASGHNLDWFIPVTENGATSLKLNPIYTGIFAEGFITAGGRNSGGGGGASGGGLIQTVYGVASFGGTFDSADNTSTFNAHAINSLDTRIRTLEQTPGGTTVSWGNTSGYASPLTVAGTTKTVLLNGALSGYATQEWVNGRGFLTSHQSLAGYATQEWVNGQGFLTSYSEQYRGTVTGIKLGPVSYSPTNGIVSLPAYPTSLKSPYSLSFGSKTYDGSEAETITAADLGALTSHQSLSGYVTLSTAQTISGAKTFSADLTAGADVVLSANAKGIYGKDTSSNTVRLALVGSDNHVYYGDSGKVTQIDANGQLILYWGSYASGRYLIGGTGDFLYTTNFLPNGNSTRSLGASSSRWLKLWADNADLDGSLNVMAISPYDTVDSHIGSYSTPFPYAYFRSLQVTGGVTTRRLYLQDPEADYPCYLTASGTTLQFFTVANERPVSLFSASSSGLALDATQRIQIGPVTIEYNATAKALYIHGTDNGTQIGIYTDGPNTGGGTRA